MRKLVRFLVVGLFVCVAPVVSAQFDKGDKIVDLGVGLNSYLSGGFPLHAALEFGVSDAISIGPGVDFLSHRFRAGSINYSYAAWYTGFRVSYHFNKVFRIDVDQLDIYGGGSVGFRTVAWSDTTPVNPGSIYNNGVYGGAHVGARWYFKPGFGVFLELGAGGSGNARGGVSFRF